MSQGTISFYGKTKEELCIQIKRYFSLHPPTSNTEYEIENRFNALPHNINHLYTYSTTHNNIIQYTIGSADLKKTVI